MEALLIDTDHQVIMVGIKMYAITFQDAPVNLAMEVYDSLVTHLSSTPMVNFQELTLASHQLHMKKVSFWNPKDVRRQT